jgi:hypothetical protein
MIALIAHLDLGLVVLYQIVWNMIIIFSETVPVYNLNIEMLQWKSGAIIQHTGKSSRENSKYFVKTLLWEVFFLN